MISFAQSVCLYHFLHPQASRHRSAPDSADSISLPVPTNPPPPPALHPPPNPPARALTAVPRPTAPMHSCAPPAPLGRPPLARPPFPPAEAPPAAAAHPPRRCSLALSFPLSSHTAMRRTVVHACLASVPPARACAHRAVFITNLTCAERGRGRGAGAAGENDDTRTQTAHAG